MSKFMQNQAIAYLLIINLMGSLFVPALASAMGSQTRVLLCTSQGYQWVTLETAQELKLTGENLGSEHCVYCLSSDDDLEQAVSVYIYLELAATEYIFLTSADYLVSNNHFFVNRPPRAPPFFI